MMNSIFSKKHVFNLVIFSHMHRATQLQHNTVKRLFTRCGSRNFSKEGGGGEEKNGQGEIFHFLFWKKCMIICACKKRENLLKSNKYTRYILVTFFVAKYFSIPRRINTMDLHVRPQILVSLEQQAWHDKDPFLHKDHRGRDYFTAFYQQ